VPQYRTTLATDNGLLTTDHGPTHKMSQLITLIWLKWRLFRNSLRSSKAVFNQLASILGLLLALVLALLVAIGLGFAAYVLTHPEIAEMLRRPAARRDPSESLSTEFILFSIFAFIYLMWATVPLSIGGSKQFEAGKLLLYPITLRKLFALDFLSEITSIHSIFAIPAIVAMCIGAGLGSGNLAITLLAALPATAFGLALSKWLSTTIGSVVRRKRARGETIIALVGAAAGLGGALAGQVAPILMKHAESLRALRWTPPGAAAYLLDTSASDDPLAYIGAYILLTFYTAVLVIGTYWLSRRAALGLEGKRRRQAAVVTNESMVGYTGWKLPLLSAELSAIVEKELRYALRNAQLRMLALMPLILIVIRLFNSRSFGHGVQSTGGAETDFLTYASGLIATGGVLYVFLLLAGLSCNLFAFEESGMRTLILSPVPRWKILFGKNLAVIILALVFSTMLLFINAVVFRDIDASILLFALLSFVCFAALTSLIGNWFSISFPKRMQFGKRLNVSGIAGLLLIPLLILLSLPPFLSTLAGYFTQSLLVEYATLASLATAFVGLYFFVIDYQGRALERREVEILDAVREPDQ
jgi:hypothetical protein